MSDNFRGLLILPKAQRPSSQTLGDLRKAGYVVLFLENVDNYRITNHVAIDVNGSTKLLLQKFFEAKELDYKREIEHQFGKASLAILRDSLKGSGTVSPTTAIVREHAGNCSAEKTVEYSPSNKEAQ